MMTTKYVPPARRNMNDRRNTRTHRNTRRARRFTAEEEALLPTDDNFPTLGGGDKALASPDNSNNQVCFTEIVTKHMPENVEPKKPQPAQVVSAEPFDLSNQQKEQLASLVKRWQDDRDFYNEYLDQNSPYWNEKSLLDPLSDDDYSSEEEVESEIESESECMSDTEIEEWMIDSRFA